MSTLRTPDSSVRKPIRLWPGLLIVTIQWILRFVVPAIYSGGLLIGVFGAMAGLLAMVLWWLFFSRAPWLDRIGGVAMIVAGYLAAMRLVDVSIATGAMGMLLAVFAPPFVCLAFVLSVAAGRKLAGGPRRAIMAAGIILAFGGWTLVKTGGFDSKFRNDFQWRWAKTAEDRLL